MAAGVGGPDVHMHDGTGELCGVGDAAGTVGTPVAGSPVVAFGVPSGWVGRPVTAGFVGTLFGGPVGTGLTEVHPTATSARPSAPVISRRPNVTLIGIIGELWTRLIDVCFFTVCRLDASRTSPIFPSAELRSLASEFRLPPSERGAPIGQAPLVSFCP